MNYREKIKKAIECPQFGNTHYGEWGALTLEQRKSIRKLLDELEGTDIQLKELQQENQQLKDNWNKLKTYIKEEIILDFYNDKLPFEIIVNNILTKTQELEKGKSE